MDAIETGADFVDIEYALPPEFRERLFRHRGGSHLILSTHLPDGTPSCEDLDGILGKMAATGADIIKIVTYAGSWEDNLRVLGLIPKARAQEIKIIAFCMGPRGKIGRVLAHLMGSHVTFASLGPGQESASGQIFIQDMKHLVEVFSL